MSRRLFPRAVAALLVVGAACAAPQRRADDSVSSRSERPVDDRARLEREARALASTGGCASAGECRAAPVGWRSCGGPRTYIVYCAATTDSVALYRKLDSLKEAEIAYNAKSGMMSTCEMRRAPNVAAQGGRCTQSP